MDASDGARGPNIGTWKIEDASATGIGAYDLTGVWGTATDNVYVIGAQGSASNGASAIFRWSSGADGLKWRNVYAGADGLRAIGGSGPSDIWAAGGGSVGFDGNVWSPRSPQPGPTVAIWAAGPNDYWAAGDWDSLHHFTSGSWKSDDASFGLFYTDVFGGSGYVYGVASSHFGQSAHSFVRAFSNGKRILDTNFDESNKYFTQVWASGPSDIFAAGPDGIIHWNGGTLERQSSVPLSGIWGFYPDDVFAVGGQTVLHYDGKKWTSEPLPAGAFELTRVWGASPDDVWAVGKSGVLLHRTP